MLDDGLDPQHLERRIRAHHRLHVGRRGRRLGGMKTVMGDNDGQFHDGLRRQPVHRRAVGHVQNEN